MPMRSSKSVSSLATLAEAERLAIIGKYMLMKKLGSGTYSIVREGVHTVTGRHVAVKLSAKSSRGQMERLQVEIDIGMRMHHRNVIEQIEVCENSDFRALVLELAVHGEVFQKIVDSGRMEEGQVRKLFRQLVAGVGYVHSQGVAHRDLKPENLLVDERGVLKIIDFGVACVLGEENKLTHVGTPEYAAPEVWADGPYDGRAADVWAMGVILYVVSTGKQPFFDEDAKRLRALVCECKLTYPSDVSAELVDLMKRMLVVDPKKRATLEEVRDHQWTEWHDRHHATRHRSVTQSSSGTAGQSVPAPASVDDMALQPSRGMPSRASAGAKSYSHAMFKLGRDELGSTGSKVGSADEVSDSLPADVHVDANGGLSVADLKRLSSLSTRAHASGASGTAPRVVLNAAASSSAAVAVASDAHGGSGARYGRSGGLGGHMHNGNGAMNASSTSMAKTASSASLEESADVSSSVRHTPRVSMTSSWDGDVVVVLQPFRVPPYPGVLVDFRIIVDLPGYIDNLHSTDRGGLFVDDYMFVNSSVLSVPDAGADAHHHHHHAHHGTRKHTGVTPPQGTLALSATPSGPGSASSAVKPPSSHRRSHRHTSSITHASALEILKRGVAPPSHSSAVPPPPHSGGQGAGAVGQHVPVVPVSTSSLPSSFASPGVGLAGLEATSDSPRSRVTQDSSARPSTSTHPHARSQKDGAGCSSCALL